MKSTNSEITAALTRREFVMCSGAAAVTLVAVPSASHATATLSVTNEPTVSFFLDQPYLDLTGLDTPYLPPHGMRSGQLPAEQSLQSLPFQLGIGFDLS